MLAVVLLGAFCLSVAFYNLPVEAIDLNLLVLLGFTIGIGSRVSVQIPRFKSHIAVSDTFIFLALLIYGGEIAIILSAIEAFCSSLRFCTKRLTILFNTASMAISTSAVVTVLHVTGFYFSDKNVGDQHATENFLVALCLIALVQFFVNTALATFHDSIKNAIPMWETWKSKYVWSFITYSFGAASAGILKYLADSAGFIVIFATFPVVFFIFLAYRMWLKNLEMSMQQTEQAKEHATVLQSQAVALRESEERFRSAFDHAPIGIAIVSASGNWQKVNRALCNILGYSEEEFLTMDFQSVVYPDDLGKTLVVIHEVLSGKSNVGQIEHRNLDKYGNIVWTSIGVSLASDSTSNSPNMIFQIQDISEKKRVEERLQHDATHDVLTGLPNRALFMQRLENALTRASENKSYKVSILFIDLDRFKYVNDSLGHLVGDQLLIGISERLRDCMRPSDTVARLGGDEFTILVEGSFEEKEVIRIAERIQQKFRIPFNLSDNEVYSSASIGILHASEKHLTPEDMMRDADSAMYQAKRSGKARHEVFDEKMHVAAKETLRLDTDLRRAIENDELFLEYQPIFSLQTGEIQGVEALARWNHSEIGAVSPSRFIPLAEEISLIDELGELLLKKACSEISSIYKALGRTDLTLSVNISCKQFGQPALATRFKDILDEAGFDPRRLRLEITESVFLDYQEKAVETLNELRALGIAIDIDDFGTGYSNLSYLTKLPISTLKIDRSFVSPIDKSGKNTEVVQTVLAMARNLGLKTVAEGIETESQRDALIQLGCDGGQGFLLARPTRLEALEEIFLANDHNNILQLPFEDVAELPMLQ